MTTKLTKLLIIAGLALSVSTGCKDKDAEKKEAPVEVLDAASNGSPIAAKFVKFTGEGENRGMEVLLYNTGDKAAAGYTLLFRYYDASDKLLKVKPGTSFESDTDWTTMSGAKFKCEPKKNATLEIDGMAIAVPADAVRAEVLATQVGSADGSSIWKQENPNDWPAG